MNTDNDKTQLKARVMKNFELCYDTVALLRDPKNGCPWDLEQTFESLRKFMLEEAYEASEAMGMVKESEQDSQFELCDELGDILMQVLLNSQLAADAGYFTVAEVAGNLNEKLIRRHPHVFGEGAKLANADEVLKQWARIKKAEGAERKKPKDYFRKNGVDKVYPATLKAEKIGKLAKTIAFDWPDLSGVVEQFISELEEFKVEWQKCGKEKRITSNLRVELSDIYFSLAQICRHLGESPEVVAEMGNQKFLNRFTLVEELAKREGIDIEQAGTKKLESLWQKAKATSQESS